MVHKSGNICTPPDLKSETSVFRPQGVSSDYIAIFDINGITQ
jgi:hypothetical protein